MLHSASSPSYNCVACCKSFTSWKNFKRHGIEVHQKTHRFQCRCGFKTNRNETLRRHTERKHRGVAYAKSLLEDVLIEVCSVRQSYSADEVENDLDSIGTGNQTSTGYESVEESDNYQEYIDPYVLARDRYVASIQAEFHKLFPSFVQEVRDLSGLKRKRSKKKVDSVNIVPRRSGRLKKNVVNPSFDHINGSGDHLHEPMDDVSVVLFPELVEEENDSCSSQNDSVGSSNEIDNDDPADDSLCLPVDNQPDNNLGKYACLPCKKAFRDSTALKRHVGLIHSARSKPVKCPRSWCNETFPIVAEMNEHKKNCYKECRECLEKFTRNDRFLGHLRRHARMNSRME